jgi:serine/threonine protein kinase/class 3 adenylate cyclase
MEPVTTTSADRTMPAMVEPATKVETPGYEPIAQLGAGPDGVAVLARMGANGRLVELRQLTCLSSEGLRWAKIRERLRVIAQLRLPMIRSVIEIDDTDITPVIVLEGDNGPILAEAIERGAFDPDRAVLLVGQLAVAISAAHRIGVHHGALHPLSIQIANGDRLTIELTGTRTFGDDDHVMVRACRAPELATEDVDGSSDVYALGTILRLLRGGASPTRAATSGPIDDLVRSACQVDRDLRPSAADFAKALAEIGSAGGAATIDVLGHEAVPRASAGMVIGRYELESAIGVGGMGEVWRARDIANGTVVALKILKPDVASNPEVVRRFRKEARVLAACESPHIANLLDVNQDRGLHYLVLEFVAGGSVSQKIKKDGKLPEDIALDIVADACRALAEPHRRGIVHRDVKPENMMLLGEAAESSLQRIKLGDFGIARATETDGTQHVTREGAVLGTPEYMAPEQCQGKPVTPATDVYALGASLYSMLIARPPFVDETPMGVIMKQIHERPARVDDVRPDVSPATADLVERALDKDPQRRYADAAEMLVAIEGLRHGTPALITAHPAPPIHRQGAIQHYVFEWELASSPEQLWPHVSNTEKMNRASGLAPVKFEVQGIEPGTAEVTGMQRAAGLTLQWREHPYEWVEGYRFVVLRVFERGVLRWYVAEVDLARLPNGGTRLRNAVHLEPRGIIARIVSKWELGRRYKKNLDKVYRRLDALISSGDRRGEIDPLQPEIVLSPDARARIEKLGEALVADGITPPVADGLVGFLLHASDQDIARIRPLEVASRLRLPAEPMIEACLRACQHGALTMLWDVVCPSCKIPSNVIESLQKIADHSHCKACNLEFAVDMSRAVELIFRAHPSVREVETRTFCVGGPANFPHVVAQVRLQPEERFALPLKLAPGRYQVRSPQLQHGREIRVSPTGGVRRHDLVMGERAEAAAVLTAGDQLVTLINPLSRELVIRVERAGDREHALTAARAVTVSAFRTLFPDQILAPGRLLSVTQNVLVVATLDDAPAVFRRLGDAAAFELALRWFDRLGAVVAEHGGVVVKTFGGLVLAAFANPTAAVEAALAMQPAIDRDPVTNGMLARIAVHQGSMMVLTVNGQLDYFGQNVELALDLPAHVEPGTIAISASVMPDPGVHRVLAGRDAKPAMHRVFPASPMLTSVVASPRAAGGPAAAASSVPTSGRALAPDPDPEEPRTVEIRKSGRIPTTRG